MKIQLTVAAAFALSLIQFFPGNVQADDSPEAASLEAGRRFDLAQAGAASAPPVSGHIHYWQGMREDDSQNVVSKASLIRHARTPGHLVNALPPVALAGAGRWWGQALAGEHGRDNRLLTVTMTILLPIGLFMIASLAAAVVVDNLWDAVDDAGRR